MRISDVLNDATVYSNQPSSYAVKTKGNPEIPEQKDSVELSDESSALRAIAVKYDVRNISPRQMANMSRELYDAGLISLKEHALLSFQISLNTEQMARISAAMKAQGKTVNIPGPDTPVDFIADWNKKLELQKQTGANPEFIKNTERIINILETIQSAHER
ncbi:MAG TPA: hypothetical protein VGK02_01055 [Candidatus Aquicultor sp.]|jgi:hypothetical protein